MEMNTKSTIIATALILGIGLCPTKVLALGLAVPDQDAFATARGNAFAATANDPSAIFYNPAGISQLDGFNVSLGAYGVMTRDRYSYAGGSVDSKTIYSVLPQFYATYSMSNHLSFGVGFYEPYGLRMEWPSSAPFAGVAQFGEVSYLRGAAEVAWQIAPCLSVAAGPTFNYSQADIKEDPGFVNHFRGRATDAGYVAGLLFHPGDQHYFGLTYRSATEMNYNGHATLPVPMFRENVPVTADFHYPDTLVFGYSFRPNSNWNFEADANWTDWSCLKTVTIEPLGEALQFDWTPSWMLDFGVTRYLDKGWRVSGGYMYSENSSPAMHFSPLVPDSDRHVFSVGVGKKCGDFSWDLAYQLGWGPSRTVYPDPAIVAAAPPTGSGTYAFLSHALSLTLAYHF
jgi:long-chain fatty acid transport protein